MTHASYFGTLPKLDKSCCIHSGFDYRNLLLSIKGGFILRIAEKIRVEAALNFIAEAVNFEKFSNWNDFNQAIREKDDARAIGDNTTAARKLKHANKLKSRAAEIADIIDAINELDKLFHRTF